MLCNRLKKTMRIQLNSNLKKSEYNKNLNILVKIFIFFLVERVLEKLRLLLQAINKSFLPTHIIEF